MARDLFPIVATISVIAILLSGAGVYLAFDSFRTQQEIRQSNEAAVQRLEDQIDQLQEVIDDLDGKIRDVESAAVTLGQHLLMVSKNNAQMATTLNQTLLTNLARLESELVSQGLSLSQNLTQIREGLRSDILETRSRLEAVQSAVETLNSRIDNVSLTVELINSDLGELASNVSRLEEGAVVQKEASPVNVYESAHRSVVVIRTPSGQGSGFVYHRPNIILTNWHVVTNETDIEIEFYDRTRQPAKIIGTDAYSDVAVVSVPSPPPDVEPLRLGDSSNLYIGQQVVAIGNPLGLTGSLSSGFVSQINRQIDLEGVPLIVPVLQLDVTIAPGSSGGPLLDLSGRVVGITNAGTSEGFNFAVPSNIVKRVATSLIETGFYSHPLFGFSAITLDTTTIRESNVLNVEPFQTGLLVIDVTPGLPAEAAGLTPAVSTTDEDGLPALLARDIVLAIDGHPIVEWADWRAYVAESVSPGQPVTLTLWRSGDVVDVEVTPTSRPQYNR